LNGFEKILVPRFIVSHKRAVFDRESVFPENQRSSLGFFLFFRRRWGLSTAHDGAEETVESARRHWGDPGTGITGGSIGRSRVIF
jgi:hypothetical protein